MSIGRNRGFTLVEAMVSVVLLAVGITAILGTLGEMTKARGRSIATERMQQLAFDKYDELVGTGDYTTPSLSGDFQDRNESRYTWRAEFLQTGTTNLESFTVYVDPVAGPNKGVQATGLVYVPPTTVTGTGTVAGGGTGTGTGGRGGGTVGQ